MDIDLPGYRKNEDNTFWIETNKNIFLDLSPLRTFNYSYRNSYFLIFK